jgi:uncharacterized protein YndB with AHSA1/START domain
MTPPEEQPPNPRSIELEIEVPGTPEEVWAAIATGPGISAWLHPTEFEKREGGRFRFDLGLGPPQEGTVTAWEPPRRFAQEVAWSPTGGASAARLATEWHVQARDGGTCVVRMVMTGFGSGADWDQELEGMAADMRLALDTLAATRGSPARPAGGTCWCGSTSHSPASSTSSSSARAAGSASRPCSTARTRPRSRHGRSQPGRPGCRRGSRPPAPAVDPVGHLGPALQARGGVLDQLLGWWTRCQSRPGGRSWPRSRTAWTW